LESGYDIAWMFKDTEFYPHTTIAYKDLKENVFPKTWKHFRRAQYKNTFNASALNVLKHDGKEWQIFKIFEFGRK
jgi:2'-5' RNA ligase